MPYYRCQKCGAKLCGWGVGKFCSKCKGLMRKVSQEEFYYPSEEEYRKVIRRAEQVVDHVQVLNENS